MIKVLILGAALIIESLASPILQAQNRRRPGSEPANRNITSVITPKEAPASLAELVGQSSLIVLGTCEKELPSRFFLRGNPKADIVTDRIVDVENVFKGDAAVGTRIAVEELGGSLTLYDGEHSIMQNIVHERPIQQGHKYLLFLKPEKQSAGDQFDGRRFVVTGVWSGSFEVVNGTVSVSRAAEPALRQLDGVAINDVLGLVQNAIRSASH